MSACLSPSRKPHPKRENIHINDNGLTFRIESAPVYRTPSSLYFTPRGEAKSVTGPSGRGARRLAPATRPYKVFHETRDTNHGFFRVIINRC